MVPQVLTLGAIKENYTDWKIMKL